MMANLRYQGMGIYGEPFIIYPGNTVLNFATIWRHREKILKCLVEYIKKAS